MKSEVLLNILIRLIFKNCLFEKVFLNIRFKSNRNVKTKYLGNKIFNYRMNFLSGCLKQKKKCTSWEESQISVLIFFISKFSKCIIKKKSSLKTWLKQKIIWKKDKKRKNKWPIHITIYQYLIKILKTMHYRNIESILSHIFVSVLSMDSWSVVFKHTGFR